ncbi:hypothetical protein GQ457_14G026950 [Hibiscus cannabinus]
MVYSAALLDFRVWLRYSPCDNLGSILRLDGPRRGVRGGGQALVHLDEVDIEQGNEETLPPLPPVGGEANEGGLTLVFAIMQISSLWRQEGKAIAEGPETFRKGYETFSMKVPNLAQKFRNLLWNFQFELKGSETFDQGYETFRGDQSACF